ncbi:endonuclease/exonuclease/phosphatase family protein [Marinilabilia sp.]|uniref:endonuclease/exonuclease/phosphatase family protein n=1 Tax=Marinilabilia sp. TaxID=2021252 RepID=UPI0025BFA0CD|nr:endonuclease/exonuclease/phosphatase family protein [Marinilabilia sp.]
MKRLFRSISLIVTLVLAFGLIASMAVIYVSPVRIHVITFLGFLFPALWLINLLILFVHIFRKSPRLIIPLLVLALSWNQWNNVFQLTGEKAPEQLNTPVKVMSYNTRMFDYYEWSGQTETPEGIYQFIREENPDIICFQEYFTSNRKEGYHPNQTKARFRALGYNHIEYRFDNGRGTGYGIATFSKFPIVKKGSLPFSDSKNMSIFTDINVKGKIVRIFNNHLESIGFKENDFNVIDSLKFEMDAQQRQGIKQIVKKMSRAFRQRSSQAEILARHIGNSPYPVVVCGDFNDTPISYVYRTMRGDLKDAFRESGSGFGGTYNGRLPSLRIDYIFHAPSFQSYDFKRHDIEFSDHYPVSTLIDLAPKKENNE